MDFIKNYSLHNIRNKLLALYMLNVTDIIFTILLLNTGFYMEANSLVSKLLQSPLLSLISKIVLPAVLFMFIYDRMRKATDRQLKQSNLLFILFSW